MRERREEIGQENEREEREEIGQENEREERGNRTGE